MGSGSYSAIVHLNADGSKSYSRADTHTHAFYCASTADSIFTQKQLHLAMSPKGIQLRESRDSKEHPTSLAIILALDVTGSMMDVPDFLVKEGLPNIMGSIMEKGVKDPQILFLGIGDHECDRAPLQVSQFESSDKLLDKWLTQLYLEGGGGGNEGESYLLAWYFAGKHTSIDCFEKRGEKGFLFTIGDEPALKSVGKSHLEDLMGDGEYADSKISSLLKAAQEKYNVYHIHVSETPTGKRPETLTSWKKLLGENVVVVDDKENVAKTIADIISKNASVKTAELLPAKGEVIL